ncbi:MAG: hypothetical protein WCI31_06335 [Prolixibacteraceae bacterium]
MEPRETNWSVETCFYLLDINGILKFGITSNWGKRLILYKKEVGDFPIRILKKELYDKRWKAELVEQVIKWRLRPWCFKGRHEWINAPIQLVWNCYLDTRERISPEFGKYEHIHKTGNDRWGHYKQIVDLIFEKGKI